MNRTPLFLALLAACPLVQAQSPATPAETTTPAPIRTIPRIEGAIVVDGKMDEAVWSQALEVAMPYEISPGDNIAPPAKTEARIGYDDEALYVAFRAQDPDPRAIRARLRDRDAAYRDDFIGVILDTFGDQRRAYEFFVNPLGVQMDLINDQTAGGNEDDSWDGLWSSAGRITDQGYEVEMRIPFATLRFRDASDVQRWGIDFFRSYPRNSRHQISSSRVSRDSNCFICSFDKFEGMTGVKQGRNLEIVPTVTVTRPEYRTAARTPWRNDGVDIEPGVDIAWSPSPNMTLNATINPDFSQVESDQAQLNLNDNFALFYPEKRPFFLEGADYFNTQLQVLYTRQINDPDAGVRITGGTDHGAYGAFVARDNTVSLLVPGPLGSYFEPFEMKTDVAVGRYRHNFGENTTIGVIGTFRHGDDYSNDVAGFDGRWQKGPHTLTGQVLFSDSKYPSSLGFADETPSGHAARAYYGYSNRDWSFNTWHVDIDPGFRADLGFIGQVGYDKSLIGGGRTWYGDSGEKIKRWDVYADFDITHDSNGQLLEREWEGSFSLQGPMQSNASLVWMARDRFWQGSLFDEYYVALSGNFIPKSGVRLGGRIEHGDRIDLRAVALGRSLTVNTWSEIDLGRGINLTHDITWQRLSRDGGTAFTATIFDTRLSWQLDPRQRLRLAVQGSRVYRDPTLYASAVNELARDYAVQLLYSYKVNPRTAFYAGVSYGSYMDDANPDMFGYTRNLFLKYSYAWQPTF